MILKKCTYYTFLILKMGFDGLFFARVDYQDYEQRNKTKTMEMVWKGSDNLGKSCWQCPRSSTNTHACRPSELAFYGCFVGLL
jgi:hypothetical protein